MKDLVYVASLIAIIALIVSIIVLRNREDFCCDYSTCPSSGGANSIHAIANQSLPVNMF